MLIYNILIQHSLLIMSLFLDNVILYWMLRTLYGVVLITQSRRFSFTHAQRVSR